MVLISVLISAVCEPPLLWYGLYTPTRVSGGPYYPSAGLLLVILQQVAERRKGLIGGRWLFLAARQRFAGGCLIQILLVLVVVTVETKQLPIAAVRGVVIVIVVLVMDR